MSHDFYILTIQNILQFLSKINFIHYAIKYIYHLMTKQWPIISAFISVSWFLKEYEKNKISLNTDFYNLLLIIFITFLKCIHFFSIFCKWQITQHLPLSKDWQTVYEHIESACGLWQPVPTLLHQLVNYIACGNSCESNLFYLGILLQKPSQHCQLPAGTQRNSNSLKKKISHRQRFFYSGIRDTISIMTINVSNIQSLNNWLHMFK